MNPQSRDIQAEQAVFDAFERWADGERPNRRQLADRAYQRALTVGDEAAWQHAEIMERSYGQLADMATYHDPYFARIKGRMRDLSGELFDVDLRVHRYHRSETFPADSGQEVLDISHLAPLADLVRNPQQRDLQITLTDREFLQWEGDHPHIEVLDSTVEDIEVENGRVTRVAPRYGAIFEDRVRRRLQHSALPALDVLADVLDEEQNAIVGNRSHTLKLLILDGPAGTGKTVVAAHRIAVAEPPDSPGLYVTPTTTLRDYVNPVLPRLGLDRTRARAVSLVDLAAMMWPDLPWDEDLSGMALDAPCSWADWASALASTRSGTPKTSWEGLYRRAAAKIGFEPGARLKAGDAALLLAMGAIVQRPRPQPVPRWIIVDEAQAVPIMAFEALNRWLGDDSSWVVAGDLMQQGSWHGWGGWNEIRKALGLPTQKTRILWLSRSYRVPPKIHAAAERLRTALNPHAKSSESVPWHPHPGKVRVTGCETSDALAATVRDLIAAMTADGLTAQALIAPNLESLNRWEAMLSTPNVVYQRLTGNRPYRGGLVLTELDNARGLEFDGVILLDVDAAHYPAADWAARQLYTSLTRARRQAHLVYTGTASPWIAVLVPNP